MNQENIFHKIVKKIIPSTIVEEDQWFLTIADIKPQDNIHLLILPKKYYQDLADFMLHSTTEEKQRMAEKITHYTQTIPNLSIITNLGDRQEIKYFHIHIIGHEDKL